MLPKQLACGSGMTCWRRLRDWQHAGIWDLTHCVLLNWLSRVGQIDWSRAVVDSCSVRAVFGGRKLGRIRPIELNGAASHLICDGRGIPLAIELTGANCHDSTQALLLLDAIPPLQGPRARPRSRPDCILEGIGPTTQRKFAVLCLHVTSRRYSQCAIRKTAAVWDDGAGS